MSDFWSDCLAIWRKKYASEVFRNWFAELSCDASDLERGAVTLITRSSHKARALQASYGEEISKTICGLLNRPIELRWRVESGHRKDAPPEAPRPDPEEQADSAGLLPHLTFENLVQGGANQLAWAAGQRVAADPGVVYNPLFIYGGVGLGKTHLMHAIGHQILRNRPGSNVRCVSAQQYISEFTAAARSQYQAQGLSDQMRGFERRYQDLDVLLIDDIQGFASRDGTQANFFQVFESMVPRGKQLVLTSDTYPRNLKDFQERLLSRLTQGLVVAVEPPDQDMREQILMQKADRAGLSMPADVAETIAKRLKSNVRELEGAVQQIYAYTRFHHLPVTMDSARAALRDVFERYAVPLSVSGIQQVVADFFHLQVSDMYSRSRKAPIVRARQIAMYLAKELTHMSLPEIAKLFGKRDHTTVLYACRKIADGRAHNDDLKRDLNMLEQLLRN